MSKDVARLEAWHGLQVDVEVRAADSRRGDLDDHILLLHSTPNKHLAPQTSTLAHPQSQSCPP